MGKQIKRFFFPFSSHRVFSFLLNRFYLCFFFSSLKLLSVPPSFPSILWLTSSLYFLLTLAFKVAHLLPITSVFYLSFLPSCFLFLPFLYFFFFLCYSLFSPAVSPHLVLFSFFIQHHCGFLLFSKVLHLILVGRNPPDNRKVHAKCSAFTSFLFTFRCIILSLQKGFPDRLSVQTINQSTKL